MRLGIALCQLRSSEDTKTNLENAVKAVCENDADVFLFPEMFLTRYGVSDFDREAVAESAKELENLCRTTGKAVVMGMPSFENGEIFNSLCFFSENGTVRYDKLYLADFPPYNEEIFAPGSCPRTVEYKGMKFGLLICYDVMFPEIHRYYGTHGADAVLMASASAEPSEPSMERILPARSLENTVYTLFCNNTGDGPAGRFFGGSAMFTPLGEKAVRTDGKEGITVVTIDSDEIAGARQARHHLEDLRDDIDWS